MRNLSSISAQAARAGLFGALVSVSRQFFILIRGCLPADIAACFAYTPPELSAHTFIDEEFIDEELRRMRSDRLFAAVFSNRNPELS